MTAPSRAAGPGRAGAAPLSTGSRVLLIGAAAVVAGAVVVPLVGGLAPAMAVRGVTAGVFVAAGAIVWAQGKGRVLGWLLLLCGGLLALINLGLFAGPVAATLRVLTGGYAPFGAVLLHLLVSYPDGRLRNRSERAVVWSTYGATLAYVAGQLTVGDRSGQRFCQPDGCEGVFRVLVRSDAASRALGTGIAVVYPVLVLLAVWAVVRRFRGLAPASRRVLRPALVSTVAAAGLGLFVVVARGLQTNTAQVRLLLALVVGLGVAVVPIGLLLGVLRGRLVVYGFGDLLAHLSEGAPVGEVDAVVGRLLGDPAARVLLAAPGGAGYTDLAGRPAVLPTAGSGRTWLPVGRPVLGAVVCSEVPAPPPRVLDAVRSAVALLLHNQRLQGELAEQLAQVRASRARIVQAADDERRRIERDLHDGAQQYLVSTALAVRLARQAMRDVPDEAEALLAQAEQQLRAALDEVRQLARGIYPAVLVDHGVGAAVESLAERLPLDVAVADRTTRRAPGPVEAAAYYVACEALVNVTKHAAVHEARVCLWEQDGSLAVEVVDHGCGDVDPARGSGLRGLDDRVTALGGTITIAHATGSGTTVRAFVPGIGALA